MDTVKTIYELKLSHKSLCGILLFFLTTIVATHPAKKDSIKIESNIIKIVFSEKEAEPLTRTFQLDSLLSNITLLKEQALK